MKIAVICHLDYPIASPFAGGLETHTWHLCSALIKRGHQVTTFASGDSDPRLNVRGIVKTSLHLASSASVSEREGIKQRAYQNTLQQIRQSDFDIIHNNSLNTLPLLQAGGLNQPMVTVLHTPPFKKLSAAVALAAKSAHACFVSVSNAVALQWQPFTNSRVIYNGIDVASWPFQTEPKPKSAIWFGRFVPEKNPHNAILAARTAGFTIDLAGPIIDIDYFREKVTPLLEDDNVRYLGHLTHAQLKQAVGRAAVFVKTPLWEEPYGLVYAESLACGTPVATVDRGAAKEILTPACGRVATSRSQRSLANAICEAANRSRAACRQRAVEFCQLDDMVTAYERLYEQMGGAKQTYYQIAA